MALMLFGPAGAALAQEKVLEESYRFRWMTIDALHARARRARVDRAISLSDYTAIVKLLREEELVIFNEAAAHQFEDETEHNFWRRSKLKFPSGLQSEMRLLEEGKDPASGQF